MWTFKHSGGSRALGRLSGGTRAALGRHSGGSGGATGVPSGGRSAPPSGRRSRLSPTCSAIHGCAGLRASLRDSRRAPRACYTAPPERAGTEGGRTLPHEVYFDRAQPVVELGALHVAVVVAVAPGAAQADVDAAGGPEARLELEIAVALDDALERGVAGPRVPGEIRFIEIVLALPGLGEADGRLPVPAGIPAQPRARAQGVGSGGKAERSVLRRVHASEVRRVHVAPHAGHLGAPGEALATHRARSVVAELPRDLVGIGAGARVEIIHQELAGRKG